MSITKKLTAVLLALCLLLPGFSALAVGEIQGAVDFGVESFLATADLEGSSVIDKDFELDMDGYVLTGSEGQPVLTVAAGVTLTVSNAVIYAKGDVTVPAIVLGEGAKLVLNDTVVLGAVCADRQVLSAAVVADKNAKINLNNSALIGGYGVVNAEGVSVNVNESIVLGTVAAMSDATAAVTDKSNLMGDIGQALVNRIENEKVDKLVDYLLTGRAIISVKRLSGFVTGELEGTVATFIATEKASRYTLYMDYTWIPYSVTVEGNTGLFSDDDFDGSYTATVTLDSTPANGEKLKADVEYKLNITLSSYLQTLIAGLPAASEEILDKINAYDYQQILLDKVDGKIRPYIETYIDLYEQMEQQITDVEDLLDESNDKLEDAEEALKDAKQKLADAKAELLKKLYTEIDVEADSAFADIVAEKTEEAEDEFDTKVQEEKDRVIGEIKAEFKDKVKDELAIHEADVLARVKADIEQEFEEMCNNYGITPSHPNYATYYADMLAEVATEQAKVRADFDTLEIELLKDTPNRTTVAVIETKYSVDIMTSYDDVVDDITTKFQQEYDDAYADALAEFNTKLNDAIADAEADFDSAIADIKNQVKNFVNTPGAAWNIVLPDIFADPDYEDFANDFLTAVNSAVDAEKLSFKALFDDLNEQIDAASAILPKLEDEVAKLETVYHSIVNAYGEIGNLLDEIVALYDSLDSADSVTKWAVEALPQLRALLGAVNDEVDTVVAHLNGIKNVNLAAINGYADQLTDIIDELEQLMSSSTFDKMLAFAGLNAADYDIDFGSYTIDLSPMEDVLNGAIDAVKGLQDGLKFIIDTVDSVLNDDRYQYLAELIKVYDPETMIKDIWAKISADGPDALEKLIWEAEYFAEKYEIAADYLFKALDAAIEKYPVAKNKVLAIADAYVTEGNVDALIAFAETNFPAAIAKYPTISDALFAKLREAAVKYPATAPKLEAAADKVAAYAELHRDDARELLDTIMLDYVNPFLHGESLLVVDAGTVVYLTAEGVETTAPETDEPDTTAPETDEPDTTAPDTDEPDTTAPETDEPDTTAPDTDEPDTTAPGTTAPDTSDPDIPSTGDTILSLVGVAVAASLSLGAAYVYDRKKKNG